MAAFLKRCDCPEGEWSVCPHSWVVRYRSDGGRSGRQRERRFAHLRDAKDFALKIDHDKRARIFVDPADGRIYFQDYAAMWLEQRVIAERTLEGYDSVLRIHINPAFGDKHLNVIRRQDIKSLVAVMRRKGLSASRIRAAHLVVNAVFNEAVRDKLLVESPCVGIELPDVVRQKDFILPDLDQVDALVAGLPADWAATVWLMHGCGLRIGEALAVNVKGRISNGEVLRVREQVTTRATLGPLKFRKSGDHRDIPLPQYVSTAIDKHLAEHGADPDGYLFRGRKQRFVVRRTYQEDFARAVKKAGLPPEFTPHSLRHFFASTALAARIPITEVSRWLGHKNIEITHQTYGHLVPASIGRARDIMDGLFNRPDMG